MDVLVSVPDPDLRGFLLRALSALGHRPRLEAALQLPDALLVDAGPGVVLVRLAAGERRVLRKPFALAELRAALDAA